MKNGFGIIELMVVVAIIAMIVGFADSYFAAYTTRAKINKSIMLMRSILEDQALLPRYAGGNFATHLYGQGGGYHAMNIGPDVTVFTYGSRYDGVFVGACLKGLKGIPSYVEPTQSPVTPGKYSCFEIVVKELANGLYDTSCGPAGADFGIPLSFLPKGCQCISPYGYYQSNNNPSNQCYQD